MYTKLQIQIDLVNQSKFISRMWCSCAIMEIYILKKNSKVKNYIQLKLTQNMQ